MSYRVTRYFQYLQSQAGGREDISIRDRLVCRWAGDCGPIICREVQCRVGQLGSIPTADDDRTFRPAGFNGMIAADMVTVAVGDQDRCRRQVLLL